MKILNFDLYENIYIPCARKGSIRSLQHVLANEYPVIDNKHAMGLDNVLIPLP